MKEATPAPLTLALSKGRIFEETMPLLAEAGIDVPENPESSRKLILPTSDPGLRLIIVQPLNAAREPDADPVIAVDKLSSAPGHTVIIDSDGKGARQLVGSEKTPVRWVVSGIVDE